ncbi:hypothetical protein ABZ635_21325 [Nocardiopsis sp. NPDC007018]|uniref:hypothetical protein n=1 Tax=Nocardiopsis sp. NPDC007018 TaxID=3155721 RepID=UPI0033E1F81F
MNHESLFGLPELTPVPVVMSLDDQWYQRMWNGQKSHEYRRRYVTGAPTQWFVYLAAPESRLCAVIDLGRAVEGSPQEIARLAEREHPGDGAPVLDYLAKGRNRTGYAMPILRIREFAGFTASELDRMLDGGFRPPEGHVPVDRGSGWRTVCDRLVSGPVLRETMVIAAY